MTTAIVWSAYHGFYRHSHNHTKNISIHVTYSNTEDHVKLEDWKNLNFVW